MLFVLSVKRLKIWSCWVCMDWCGTSHWLFFYVERTSTVSDLSLLGLRPGSDRDVQWKWMKPFVHHFVHLGVEGNWHIIKHFVPLVHGFTVGTGHPVELCLWKLLCSCLIVPWKLLHNSFLLEQTCFVYWTTFGVTSQGWPQTCPLQLWLHLEFWREWEMTWRYFKWTSVWMWMPLWTKPSLWPMKSLKISSIDSGRPSLNQALVTLTKSSCVHRTPGLDCDRFIRGF